MIIGRPILQVEQVQKSFGGVTAVRGPSFTIEEGKVTGLIGPNGSGKSTLFNVLTGVDHADRGSILFRGRHIEGLPSHRIARLGIGRTFQLVRVFAHLTALENLEMGAFLLRERAQVRANLERVYQLFPILAERRSQIAHTMSGGEQQMLAMGRALMLDPELLLLDEPSLGLAPRYVDLVFDKLLELKAAGMTMLIVEQNAARVWKSWTGVMCWN